MPGFNRPAELWLSDRFAQTMNDTAGLKKQATEYIVNEAQECVAIIGKLDEAPKGVNQTESEPTGLSGFGIAVKTSSGWVSLTQGTLVTGLPTSPYDGQEISYLADAANGVIWRLRYRQASESAYKWEFIGGSELKARQVTEPSTPEQAPSAAFAYTAINSAPKLTIPLAGDYDFWVGASGLNNAANPTDVRIAPAEGSTLLANDTNFPGLMYAPISETGWASVGGPVRTTGIAASTVVGIAFAGNGATAKLRFYAMTIRAHPVRVG